MKRLPLILNVLAVAALSASCAYWALQLYKPEQRPIAAPPPSALPEPAVASATGLFGGAQVAAVAEALPLERRSLFQQRVEVGAGPVLGIEEVLHGDSGSEGGVETKKPSAEAGFRV